MVADYDPTTHDFSNVQTVYTPGAAERASATRSSCPTTAASSSRPRCATARRLGGRHAQRRPQRAVVDEPGREPDAGRRSRTLNGKGGGPTCRRPQQPRHRQARRPASCGDDETGFDDTTLNVRAHGAPGRRRRLRVGGLHQPAHVRQPARPRSLASWPRSYDTTNLDQPPTKKLWVAAIDLNAPPGTDPSHPAFYLPGAGDPRRQLARLLGARPVQARRLDLRHRRPVLQRLLRAQGAGRRPRVLEHAAHGMCSGPQEKCTTAADCCDPTNVCINGFCAAPTIN